MLTQEYLDTLADLINGNEKAAFTVDIDRMCGVWYLIPKHFTIPGNIVATPFYEGTPGIPYFVDDEQNCMTEEDLFDFPCYGDPERDAVTYMTILNDAILRLYDDRVAGVAR